MSPTKRQPRPPGAPGRKTPGRQLSLHAAAEELRQARAPAAPMLLPSLRYAPPVTEMQQLNTSRLLPARYSDSVLTRIAETEDDLPLLYSLDNATNERLLAEANNRLGITARELVYDVPYARIVNAAFAHPHPQGARFSTPYRGAWYAGFELATSKAEVLFHRSVQLTEIGWREREDLDYDHYQADLSGPFHDLRLEADAPLDSSRAAKNSSGKEAAERAAAQRLACLDPLSYIASQQLAVELLEAGSLGVVYPSARRPAGTCIACFRPGVVANVRKRDLHRLCWFPDAPPTFARVARTEASKPDTAGPRAVRKAAAETGGAGSDEEPKTASNPLPE